MEVISSSHVQSHPESNVSTFLSGMSHTLGSVGNRTLMNTRNILNSNTLPTITFFLFASQFLPRAEATSDDGSESHQAAFSSTAFSLGFREMFEAAFVTSMLLQSVNRVADRSPELLSAEKQTQLKKVIAGSIVAGIIVCGIGTGAGLYAYHEHAKEEVGEEFREGMEAIMKFFISILVSGFSLEILKMLSTSNVLSHQTQEMESSITTAANTDSTWQQFRSIGIMPFAVFAGEIAEAALLIGISEEADEANQNGR